jgi:hypothetical protein
MQKKSIQNWSDGSNLRMKAQNKMSNDPDFTNNLFLLEETMGGALSIVVHTAYHLGEIRQALCTLK